MPGASPKKAAPQSASQGGPEDRVDAAWVWDRIAHALISLGGLTATVLVVAVFVFVAREGLGFMFADQGLGQLLTSPSWRPTSEPQPEFGALALITGTACVTGLAMLVAIPFALGTAIYIGEFATGKTRETLKVLVEFLAATPAVVWGFLGLTVMNPLIQRSFDVPAGWTILGAGLILGLMAAPITATIAEDALKAVPDNYREAAEGMGATRWQVTRQVVLPAAKGRIVAAVLLGVGRGFGETMAVLMVLGHSIILPTGPFDSVEVLTAAIAAELGEAARGSDHYRALFALGTLLFAVTCVINLLADVFVRKGGKQRP